MQVFRVIYALHFVFGTFLALRLWPYTIAFLGVTTVPDLTTNELLTLISISCLSTLWYFIWFGSLRFVIHGTFPVVSPKVFAILVALDYLGVATLIAQRSALSTIEVLADQSALMIIVFTMMIISMVTATRLPKIKAVWDAEQEELRRLQDERLDQMHRLTNPRIRP